jgi:hypothetical protein
MTIGKTRAAMINTAKIDILSLTIVIHPT